MQNVTLTHRYNDLLEEVGAFRDLSKTMNKEGAHWLKKVEYVAKAFFAAITMPIRFFISGIVSFIKSVDRMIKCEKDGFGNMLLESVFRVIHAVMLIPILIGGFFTHLTLKAMFDWIKEKDQDGYTPSKKAKEPETSDELKEKLERVTIFQNELDEQLKLLTSIQPGKMRNGQMQISKDKEKGRVDLEDLSDKVGEFTTAVGRKKLIRELVEILNLPEQKNVILTGKTGVGKTTIIHGLVKFLDDNKYNEGMPERLKGVKVLSFSASSIVSGTKYRGSLQEKFEELIKEVKNSEVPVILFVDEIHQLMGAGGVESDDGASSVDQLFLAHLTGKSITLIGATTPEEFDRYISPHKAFLRRFIKKEVEPLKDQHIESALNNHIKMLMDEYNILIEPNLCKIALKLSEELVFEEKNLKLDVAKKILSLAASRAQLKVLYSKKGDKVDHLTEKALQKVAKGMKNGENESWRSIYN